MILFLDIGLNIQVLGPLFFPLISFYVLHFFTYLFMVQVMELKAEHMKKLHNYVQYNNTVLICCS